MEYAIALPYLPTRECRKPNMFLANCSLERSALKTVFNRDRT
jgi:hypothetical protein